MSRWVEDKNGRLQESIAFMDQCRYLYNDICCYENSEYLGLDVSKECETCLLFTKEDGIIEDISNQWEQEGDCRLCRKNSTCTTDCDAKTTVMCSMLECEIEDSTEWGQVETDTKVLVWDDGTKRWHKRHFAKYEYGKVYVFNGGKTSWTTYAEDDVYAAKTVVKPKLNTIREKEV